MGMVNFNNKNYIQELEKQVKEWQKQRAGEYELDTEKYNRFLKLLRYLTDFARENEATIGSIELHPEHLHATLFFETSHFHIPSTVYPTFAQHLTLADVLRMEESHIRAIVLQFEVENVWVKK